MNLKKIIIVMVLSLFISEAMLGQTAELVGTAGDSYANANYRISWSIGETVTETHQNTTNVLTQGFHQNTYTVLAVDDHNFHFEMRAYPNPATDLITLEFEKYANNKFTVIVTDINGKILQSKPIDNQYLPLNFSAYVPGTYFMVIKQQNKLIKSFKIIKK